MESMVNLLFSFSSLAVPVQLETEKSLVNQLFFFLLLIPHPTPTSCLIPKESSGDQEEMETKNLVISINLINFEQDN